MVGDAATLVKATSGGGINQSLISAKILADCIDKNKSYQKLLQKSFMIFVKAGLLERVKVFQNGIGPG